MRSIDGLFQSVMLQGDLWNALGKLREAHDSFINAAAIATNVPKLSAEKWQEAFISQQSCLHAQGKNDEALANLVPLLDSEELSLIMQGLLHRTLGNIYRSAANWHKAEYYLTSAVEIAKSLGDQVREAKWTAELGRVYRSSGLHQKALENQKVAYEFALNRGDVDQLASVCGYIGFTNYSMKQPNHLEAIRYLGTRLLLAEKLLEDQPGIRWCLNNLGKIYHSMGTLEPAIRCFQKSLDMVKGTGNLLGEGTAIGNLGSVLRDAGQYKEAVKCHKQYLVNAGKRLDIGGEAIMQYELAVDHLLLGDKEQCRSYALQGLQTLEVMRSQLADTDDQLKLGNHEKNQARICNILLYVLIELGQYKAALLVSELGRARALCDLMNTRWHTNSALLAQFAELLGQTTMILDQAVVSNLCDQLVDLSRQSSSSIIIYSVVDEPAATSAEQRRQWLYIWVVTDASESKKAIHFAKKLISSKDHNFKPRLEEDTLSSSRRDIKLKKKSKKATAQPVTSSSVSVPAASPQSPKHDSSSSPSAQTFDQYSTLIAPIEAYLSSSNSPPPSRLVIIPHSFLFTVPFAALQNANGRFLVEDYVLSYAPSISVLHLIAQKAHSVQPDDGSVPLVIGNPLMPLPEVEQLAGAEDEAKSVHEIIGGELYLNKEATKELVRSSLPQHHSIIHLATHALLGNSVAEHLEAVETSNKQDGGDYTVKGAVVLGRSGPACSGILTSREVQELDLSGCQLVTLSCCSTALGKVTQDGILGLSRAILVAGATCLVTTLWPIQDKPTAELMSKFYTYYKESGDAPAAMRSAMVTLMSAGFSNEQWAAFYVTGISLL